MVQWCSLVQVGAFAPWCSGAVVQAPYKGAHQPAPGDWPYQLPAVESVRARYVAGDCSTIPAGDRGALGCTTRHWLNGIARLMSTRSLLGSLHRDGLPSFIRCLASEVHGP